MKSNSSRILGQLNLVLNNPGEYPILKESREPAVLIDSVTEQHNSYLRDKVRFIFRVLYYWHRHHCLVCYTDQTIISYSVDFCIIGQTRLYVNNTDVMQGRIENQSFCICATDPIEAMFFTVIFLLDLCAILLQSIQSNLRRSFVLPIT